MLSALERQREVYIGGAYGRKPSVPCDFDRLENAARDRLSKTAFAYIAGGADWQTIGNNRTAFAKWKIVPRVLNDVSVRDTSLEIYKQKIPAPFLLAPIGVLSLAHKNADLAVAGACGDTGVPMIFSSQASKSMESCNGALGVTPRWFQLYWSKSNDLVRSLVRRAEQCGCSAIVVTLDTTLLGWRPEDLDLAYLPFLRGLGIAQYTSDPVFKELLKEEIRDSEKRSISLSALLNLVKQAIHFPGNPFTNLIRGKGRAAVQKFVEIYSRPSITWYDLEFLTSITELPIVLKGILHPDDALKAIHHGASGIVVSNHGGRQIDGVIPSIDALPPIASAVSRKIPIFIDSGVRTGADIFRSIALGATAVLVGRPYVYALALSGRKGVKEYIKNLAADFELTMALAGCRNINEISTESLST